MESRSVGAGDRASSPNRPEAGSGGDPFRDGQVDRDADAGAEYEQKAVEPEGVEPRL